MANPHPILVVGRTRQEAQDHITTHNLPRATIAAGTRDITRRTQGLHVSEVRLLKTALDHLRTADLHHLRMIEARGKPMSTTPPREEQEMTTNQERAAEIIWEEQAGGIVKPRDLVGALADAGLLMPDLPAPEMDDDRLVWRVDKDGFVYINKYGQIATVGVAHPHDSPDIAYRHALALIAAAKYAAYTHERTTETLPDAPTLKENK